jgi:TonB family protein
VSHVAVRRGARVLADAAVEAVQEWRYTPTLLDGVAVPVIMTVTVNFKMESVTYDDLVTSLRHRDEEIRAAAARNLRGVRSSFSGKAELRDAIVALEALAEKDPSPSVRAAAAHSLSALDGRPLPAGGTETSPPAEPAAAQQPRLGAIGPDGGSRSVAWGTFVDPLGQSEIVESGGRLEISVPAGAYDLSIELGQVTAPRLMRPVDGDHQAQVTVEELPDPGPSPPRQPRRPFHGAGLLLWKDERTYVRLESAVMRAADDSLVRYALFEVRSDGKVAGRLAGTALRLDAGPTDLRFSRQGSELVAQVRQRDGDWREAGRASLQMAASVSLGIAAVNRATSPLRARFTRFEMTTAADAIAREAGSEPAKPGGPLTDFDSPPRVRKQVKPEYPREAFEARIQGTVLVEALIDEKGHIAKARVIQSVPGLDEAALDVARKWRFQPAMKNGKPVATIIHMPVSFRIGDQ